MAKRALIYQVYPASFGNLKFIAEKIPEIAATLSPDYLWINPFFVSPWREGGYDVADYIKIDPRFGTMKDFKNLVRVAEKHNIKILLDLVLNHTSVQHEWFIKSRHRDPWYADYYIWLDRPLNWQSFFGGTAYEYDEVRGQYYLHLFDKSQPDLNFRNPRVIREFHKIIDFWLEQGAAGYRVDSANVLSESKLSHGILPRIPGFFNYFQTKGTVDLLEKLRGNRKLFSIAEPVGGTFLSHRKFRQLTNKAFDASLNIGTLDVADTIFSDRTHPLPVNYKKWFKKLSKWTPEPTFSFALESHDSSRSPSRFNADPKVHAMLQFLLPSNFPCIYQGQEIGTKNPKLSDNIDDYPGVQSRAIYQRLLDEGKTKKQAMEVVIRVSRDNARQPIDWKEYSKQVSDPASVRNFFQSITELWRNDPVLIHGTFKRKKITKSGIFNFERRYKEQVYKIHLDLSGKTKSTLIDNHGKILISA